MSLQLDVNSLDPEKGLIFRIAHIKNAPWILDRGLHCGSSEERDPNFVICHGSAQKDVLQRELEQRGQTLQVAVRPDWYF